MRKKFNATVCILIIICVAAFVIACQPKDADGLIKLSTPSNLALNGSVLSWDEVSNAQEYFISVDDEEKQQSVTATTCDLSAMVTGYGNFSIKVRAYGDGKKYGTSDKSSAIVYHKGNALDTPVVTVSDKVATWSAIDQAVNYSIRVTDGKGSLLDETEQEALSYNFADKKTASSESGDAQEKYLYGDYGAYRISVIANPSTENIQYSSSLAGVATYYNSTVLAAPSFTDMTGTTIRWGAVANATNYTLRKTYEDGTYEDAETTGTSYAYRTKFNLEKSGEYSFSIRANGDNQVYYTSEFSAKDSEYVVNKLAAVSPEDLSLTYETNGSAKLKWKLAADSQATEFTLNLSGLLPDGSVKLESSVLQQTISNKIKFVVADVYDFYKYDTDGTTLVKEDSTILVYNINGFAKVRYNDEDYFLKDSEDNDVMWKDYSPSASVDIICNIDTDSSDIKFVNERKTYTDPSSGAILSQNTGDDEDVLGSDGKQLFYFEEVTGESKIEVIKGVEYDGQEVSYHTFELVLDDIFMKESQDNAGEYEYLINDSAYYGILYEVSISADNDSKNFVVSQSVSAEGQYMSYKIPQKESNKYLVTDTGEYAYIVLNSFVNPSNTDEFSIEENINFNGYEIPQVDTFGGVINGNNHTVSGIVVGNKVMTQNGVLPSDSATETNYAMFINIDDGGDTSKGLIQNVFYVGMSFVGYDKEDIAEGVTSIKVAPIAINNKGAIRNVLVQSDSINADGAQVAGMVIDNYGYIVESSVYAELGGANVGGVAINNLADSMILNVGFYGDITATLGDTLNEGVTSISGAGLVAVNEGNVANSFAIGDVVVAATGLDGVYAGGLIAINNGTVMQSYSGEFTLNNIVSQVTADGDNAYAGGLVAKNSGNITSSYATDKAKASLYSGGFVGYNDGDITSCYSTGGTTNTGNNKGAFVGKNEGEDNIVRSVAYSTDSWAADGVVEVLTSSERLDGIVDTLYGDGAADMTLVRDKGYRNPLINGLVYIIGDNANDSNRNIVTLRPSADVETQSFAYSGEVKEIEATLHGDKTKKGNRVVIELGADGVPSRYVYGYIN